MDRGPERSVVASVAGIVLAGVVFVVVWFAGGFLFNVLDHLRGLGNDRLQAVFRALVVPGVGGHLALSAVSRQLPTASIRGVFFGFSGLIFILVGLYIAFIVSAARRVELSVWEGALPILVLAAGIVGAYTRAKKHM